jgi:hypothetical protein
MKDPSEGQDGSSKKKWIVGGAIAAVILVAGLGVGLGVGLKVGICTHVSDASYADTWACRHAGLQISDVGSSHERAVSPAEQVLIASCFTCEQFQGARRQGAEARAGARLT